MEPSALFFYIFIMAGVTYLIRMLPLVLFKKDPQPVYRSFLYYIPYAVLAAMTFPAMLGATSSAASAAAGLVVAVISAWFEPGLLPVALLSCLGVLFLNYSFRLFVFREALNFYTRQGCIY